METVTTPTDNHIRSTLLSLHELTRYKATASVVLKLGKTGTVLRYTNRPVSGAV
jgi:hypothetical protein